MALDEILANIDGRDISNEEKRRLKAEAYNRVYSEMVNAGITLSFTDFSLIVLGEINVRTQMGRRKRPYSYRIYE